jgi:hypothetical protein
MQPFACVYSPRYLLIASVFSEHLLKLQAFLQYSFHAFLSEVEDFQCHLHQDLRGKADKNKK